MEHTHQYDLPTVDECIDFLEAINRGREAVGLEPVQTLDYDACEPNDITNCLSAHHLFALEPINGEVLQTRVTSRSGELESVAEALGVSSAQYGGMHIPSVIAAVTDVFDASKEDESLHAALRERMVEAGVVK